MSRGSERRTIVLFYPRTLHERNYRNFHVPYSLLSLATTLDRSRYKILVLDGNAGAANGIDPDVAADVLCVGISSMIGHQIRDGLQFASSVRSLDDSIPIVWGGALPSILPELVIEEKDVDILVHGQGQETFRILVDALAVGHDLSQVEGITFKAGARRVATPSRPFRDINQFPDYASVYDLIDPAAYVRCDEHVNDRTLSYHASQGCPFSCGFCCEVALWRNRWSGFHAKRILDDIEYLVGRYGINGIKFYDAEFFIDRRRVMGLAEGLIGRGLSIRWAAAAHPRSLSRLTEDEFALLRHSGLVRLLVGAESGDRAELDLVRKGSNIEMLFDIAKRCGKHDVFASFSFITGYPGMPAANIDTTLRFAAELRKIDPRHETKVHFYAPYPGTPLYQLALQHGFAAPKTLEQWSRYDYYNINTPWVQHRYEPIVRDFNEDNCPYL